MNLSVSRSSYPVSSSRRHLSYDDCLEDKRGNYQNCCVLCCIRQLCTMIRIHTRAVLEDKCWFRFRFSFFVRLFRFSILCFSGLAKTILFVRALVRVLLSYGALEIVCIIIIMCVVCFCCVRFSSFSTVLRQEMAYFVSSGT